MFQRFFSKVVCLNLASRHDRREQFDAQAQSIGMKFEYFTAFPKSDFLDIRMRSLRGSGHNLATYAHNLGLAAILEKCLNEDVESLLFFEDDCVFEKGAFEVFQQMCQTEMPSVWDLFYLGAWHRRPPIKVGELAYNVTKAHLAHALAIHKRIMPFLIQQCVKNEQMFDQILAEKVHPLGNSYCLHPNVANQSDGYSDLWEMHIQQSKRQNPIS